MEGHVDIWAVAVSSMIISAASTNSRPGHYHLLAAVYVHSDTNKKKKKNALYHFLGVYKYICKYLLLYFINFLSDCKFNYIVYNMKGTTNLYFVVQHSVAQGK